MIRNKFNTPSIEEVISTFISSRSERGDTIYLYIKYNGNTRPTLNLKVNTVSSDIKDLAKKEKWPEKFDITEWLPEKPYFDMIDDSTGQPVPGEMRRGFSTWQEYVEIGLGPFIKSAISSGGRIFQYEVIK